MEGKNWAFSCYLWSRTLEDSTKILHKSVIVYTVNDTDSLWGLCEKKTNDAVLNS